MRVVERIRDLPVDRSPAAAAEPFDLPRIEHAVRDHFAFLASSVEGRDFAQLLVRGVSDNSAAIDDTIRKVSEHWRIERMALVDRNILRLAVYEFLFEDTPKTVAINEALEIARRFSTFEATQFINGILDVIAKELREKGTLKKSGRGLIDNK